MQEVMESYDVSMDTVQKKKKISTALILLAVIPGAFLSNFSAGLVNIALTDISLDYHVSLSLTQWIVTGYLLTVMIFLPIMGKLSDQFGRKFVHNTGYVLFAFGILGAYLSTSLMVLLIARFIQGMGAAMLQSMNMVIITNSVPQEKRVKALGLIGTAVGLGGLLGAPVGGVLINWFSWHALFLIQLPVVIIPLILAIIFIPQDHKEALVKGKFDIVGAILFSIFVITTMYVLNQFGEGLFGYHQLLFVLIALVSITGFVRWVQQQKEPFIDLKLFKQPVVKIGSVIIVSSYAACFATIVVLPFYFRGVLQTSVTIAGLMMMIYPLFLSIFGPISGRLVNRIGSSRSVFFALLLMSVVLLLLVTVSLSSSLLMLVALLMLLGSAMGLLTSPNYNLIMENVPSQTLGTIGGTIALLRNLGMVIGTALAITIVNFTAISPVTEWLTLSSYDDKVSILHGIKLVFLTFACLIFMLSIRLYFINKKIKKRGYVTWTH